MRTDSFSGTESVLLASGELNNCDYRVLILIVIYNHSLGAHIAGMAGKNVLRGRINHIIGLDPGLN